MDNINWKSEAAEIYYYNKIKNVSIKELALKGKVSERTIKNRISEFKDLIEDLDFEDVMSKFAEVSITYGDANIDKAYIEKVSINELDEGKFYFYKNSTDELLFKGTLDEFFDKYTEYDKRFKMIIGNRHIKDSFILEKIDLRVKSDFNKKYMSVEDKVDVLEETVRNQQREINKLKEFINNYIGVI